MSLFLFDLDNTLLDTGRLVNEGFKPALQAFLGLDEATFAKLNEEYWQSLPDSTDFDPRTYTAFLADQTQKDPAQLLEIIYKPGWYQETIFPEVIAALEQLQAQHQIGLFSQGNHEYQTKKLELAGLTKFFSDELIYIFERKLAPKVLEDLPESTLIDDRFAVVETAQDFPQLTPIWLNRTNEKAHQKVRTIQSLSELL